MPSRLSVHPYPLSAVCSLWFTSSFPSRVAEYCKEFKNFNSMFAILSGLNTGTVSRLHNTWEKLPSKYQKMFDDLMYFLDPTRNMSKYRNLLNNASATPPVVSWILVRTS